MRSDYPVCAFCASQSADRYLQGGGAMICGDCAARPNAAPPHFAPGPCALCGRVIGTTRGILRRRPVIAGLIVGTAIACTECLSTCRAILAGDPARAER